MRFFLNYCKIDNCYYQSRSCWIRVNMNEVVIKILQGSAVTQTVLGGLTIHNASLPNFMQCMCADYERRLAADKVIAIKNRFLGYFWPTLYVFSNNGCQNVGNSMSSVIILSLFSYRYCNLRDTCSKMLYLRRCGLSVDSHEYVFMISLELSGSLGLHRRGHALGEGAKIHEKQIRQSKYNLT